MKENYRKKVEYIASVLRDAGYNHHNQLYAYAITGDETYITRQGDARKMVVLLDRGWLLEYLQKINFDKLHV